MVKKYLLLQIAFYFTNIFYFMQGFDKSNEISVLFNLSFIVSTVFGIIFLIVYKNKNKVLAKIESWIS